MKITGRGIARENCSVFMRVKRLERQHLVLFSLFGLSIAMALADIDSSSIGTELEVDVRGRRISAEIVQLPFYKR